MNRLSRFIDSEFTRNSWFFAQAESGMMTALDFINYVLKEGDLVNLTEKETIYIDKGKRLLLRITISYASNKRRNRKIQAGLFRCVRRLVCNSYNAVYCTIV